MRERFTQEMKAAMKSGDKRKLGTVRLIQAALKDKDIEARGAGKGQATDEEIFGLLQKMIKQRQESAELYDKGGRAELAAAERTEIDIISAYLPKQMSDVEAGAAISAILHELNAEGMKDMGRAMAALKERFAGTMDFGKASAKIKELLSARK